MTESGDPPEERRIVKNHDEFYEKKYEERPLYVGLGEFECTIDPNIVLVSKIGSGVSICIHDPEVKVGGLLNIVMPESLTRSFPVMDEKDPAYQHATDLIGRFINAVKRHGAGKKRIQIKLYGGTSIFEELVDSGLKNYVFAKEWLLEKGLMIANEDIGGANCRRLFFQPRKGKIRCYKMRRQEDVKKLREMEKTYMERIRQQYDSSGDHA